MRKLWSWSLWACIFQQGDARALDKLLSDAKGWRCVLGWIVSFPPPPTAKSISWNLKYLRMWLIWRQGLYKGNQVKMSSLEWALIPYDWCPYKKEKFEDTRTRGTPHEDEGRDGGDASTSQWWPENHQKQLGGSWVRFTFPALGGSSCQHPDLQLPVTRSVRPYTSVL